MRIKKFIKKLRQDASERVVARAVTPYAIAIYRRTPTLRGCRFEALNDQNEWSSDAAFGGEKYFSDVKEIKRVLAEKRREEILEWIREERIRRLNELIIQL